jgi:transcription elongation factor GreA
LADNKTAAEAMAHYLNSIEPERARDDRDEVERFIEWFGRDRQLGELTGDDVSRYGQQERDRLPEEAELVSLEPVRAFLAHSARLAFLDEDLVPFLGFPGAAARRTSSDQSVVGGDAYFVTIEGLASLERELEEMKAQRPVIAEALRTAMADKDFRENAPLDAARDEQAKLEAHIRQIEHQLRHAVIIDADPKAGRANVGSTIRLLNLKGGKEQTFHLVSPNEVDPSNGKISIESPVGKAVMNRGAGDEVTVDAPSGALEFRLLEVIG